MNIKLIIDYLENLKKDILGNKESSLYLAHKLYILIDKLQTLRKNKIELYIKNLLVRDKKDNIERDLINLKLVS